MSTRATALLCCIWIATVPSCRLARQLERTAKALEDDARARTSLEAVLSDLFWRASPYLLAILAVVATGLVGRKIHLSRRARKAAAGTPAPPHGSAHTPPAPH